MPRGPRAVLTTIALLAQYGAVAAASSTAHKLPLASLPGPPPLPWRWQPLHMRTIASSALSQLSAPPPSPSPPPPSPPPTGSSTKPSLKGLQVAVLGAHMEGNVGDEYETSPLLAKLGEWGVCFDIFLAEWQKGDPIHELNPRAAREFRYARAVYTFEETQTVRLARLGSYDAVIHSPGPTVSLNQEIWEDGLNNATVIWAGVTVVHNAHLMKRFASGQMRSTRLILCREISSIAVIAKAAGTSVGALIRKGQSNEMAAAGLEELMIQSTRVLLSGDFSFSFSPNGALLGYWQRWYQRALLPKVRTAGDRKKIYVLFVRAHHHVQLATGTNGSHIKVRVFDDSKCTLQGAYQHLETHEMVIEKASVFLATSDTTPKGDGALFSSLKVKLQLADDQLIFLESPEQMLGLLGCFGASTNRDLTVISDRYHPALAAHRVGAAVKFIAVEKPKGSNNEVADIHKMIGLCKMIHSYSAEESRALNSIAWGALERALHDARVRSDRRSGDNRATRVRKEESWSISQHFR